MTIPEKNRISKVFVKTNTGSQKGIRYMIGIFAVERKGEMMEKVKAIYELEDAKDGYVEYLSNDAIDMAIEALRQPEPKEGHWIPHETPDGGVQYECSRCGVLWEFNDGTPEDNEAYFCPKCGAKMQGADT